MPNCIVFPGLPWLAAFLVIFPVCCAITPAAEPTKGPPPFSEAQKVVDAWFTRESSHRPDDLISRTEATAVLKALSQKGFVPRDDKALLAKVLDDGDYLVKALRTPQGRTLARKIAAYPDGYDRLDRLARLPGGQQTVDSLIRGPGGEKLIEYMTTSRGGRNLGGQLSRIPAGADFNSPTGRIYTQTQLIERLKQEFQRTPTSTDAPTSR